MSYRIDLKYEKWLKSVPTTCIRIGFEMGVNFCCGNVDFSVLSMVWLKSMDSSNRRIFFVAVRKISLNDFNRSWSSEWLFSTWVVSRSGVFKSTLHIGQRKPSRICSLESKSKRFWLDIVFCWPISIHSNWKGHLSNENNKKKLVKYDVSVTISTSLTPTNAQTYWTCVWRCQKKTSANLNKWTYRHWCIW